MQSCTTRLINKPTRQQSWHGATWKILAFAAYAGLDGIIRYLSGGASPIGLPINTPLPVPMIVFLQDSIALLIMLPWLLRRGWLPRVAHISRSPLMGLHLFRVIISAIAVIAWSFSLVYMPLAEAVSLSILGPVLGILGAKLYLKEKIGLLRGMVLIISFGTVFYMLSPNSVFMDNRANTLGLFCVLVSALSFALAKIVTRKLALMGESSHTLTAFLLLWIVPVSLIPALFVWALPAIEHLPWLIFAGFLTALAIFSVTKALSIAEVTFLATFDFFRFILDFAVGYIVFTEIPPVWAIWLFGGLICFSLSAWYAARDEHRK